jgi:hypothetical protein
MPYLFLTVSTIYAAHVYAIEGMNPGDVSIGFDLKFGYGTSAMSFPNGTSIAIAKVVSGDEYRKTFRKLSLVESTHFA